MNDEIFGYKVRKLTEDEHKQRALDILIDVAEFCDRYNLRYFLAYGTLIGAIRHGGFIPWDDDIDIQMPRPDYEKFIRLYNECKHKGNYKVIAPNDKIARHTFAKVCDFDTVKIENGITYKNSNYLGVDVDIFPIDGVHTDVSLDNIAYKEKMRLYKIHEKIITHCTFLDLKFNIRDILRGIKRIFVYVLNKIEIFLFRYTIEDIIKKLYNLETKCKYEESEYVGSVSCLYDFQERYLKELYEGSIIVKFEGGLFKVPIGYDMILKDKYGDYMKLPPIEQQVAHHYNKVYVKY